MVEFYDDLIDDEMDNEDDVPEWAMQPCSCALCMCMKLTPYGVPCDDCLMGAHQG